MSKGILVDLNIMGNLKCIKNKTIVVWGAGDKGKYVIKMLKKAGISVLYVCDSNVKLWGVEIEGQIVISPFELCRIGNRGKLCIVLCTMPGSNPAIRKTLEQIIDVKYEYATYFGIINLFRFHYEALFRDEYIKCSFRIEKEIGKLEYQQLILQRLNNVCKVRDEDILVLQPGKVGSISIMANLMREGCSVYHFHYIYSWAGILQEEYRKIWETALKNLKVKKIKIITGVREPIARDFAAFFEAFSEKNNIRRGDWIFRCGDVYKVFRQYMEMVVHGDYRPWNDGIPEVWGDEFIWFDKEIKELWGIDVYQYPFDKENGYTVIYSEKVDIFLYKSERLNDVSEKLYEFALGYPIPEFVIENRAEDSWRNEAYQEFKRNVVLSPDYVEHYYKDNKRMDFFYTKEEKEGFLKKWENQIGWKE